MKNQHSNPNTIRNQASVFIGTWNMGKQKHTLKHYANLLEGRCRKGSNRGGTLSSAARRSPWQPSHSPHPTAPVNTSLRPVYGMYTYPKTWEGGREGGREKQASKQQGDSSQSTWQCPCKPPCSPPRYHRRNRCIGLIFTLPK